MGLYSSPKTRKKMKTHILKALGELVTYTGRATNVKYLKNPPQNFLVVSKLNVIKLSYYMNT
jgi:hypothetical protein